jgi:voltage-gated potassium channel
MDERDDRQSGGGDHPEEPSGPPAAAGSFLGQRFERSPRFADSFGLVLVMLIVSIFISAMVGDRYLGRIAVLVFLATTTWLALRASQVERRLLRIAVTLIPLATAAAIITALVGSDGTATIVAGVLIVLLVVVAPLAIVRRLATHPVINLNTFYGAVSVYLLIAMFFASMYALIAKLTGDPFFAQLQAAKSLDYLYFSFTTITTVGYGDLTAAGGVARMTAMFEAVFGQLYLITVVALVVQNLGQERRSKLHKDDDA